MSHRSQLSVEHVFNQEEFDKFAYLSGDNNPIHVDAAFASQTRFGNTVAHGLLLCSKLRGLIDQLVPGGRLTDQSVMFEAPTFAGDSMRFTVSLVDLTGEIAHINMEVVRIKDGITTCSGESRVRV